MFSNDIPAVVPQQVVNISYRSIKTASSYLKSGKKTIKNVAKNKLIGALKSEDIADLDKKHNTILIKRSEGSNY